jgi:hypothetical protein
MAAPIPGVDVGTVWPPVTNPNMVAGAASVGPSITPVPAPASAASAPPPPNAILPGIPVPLKVCNGPSAPAPQSFTTSVTPPLRVHNGPSVPAPLPELTYFQQDDFSKSSQMPKIAQEAVPPPAPTTDPLAELEMDLDIPPEIFRNELAFIGEEPPETSTSGRTGQALPSGPSTAP